MTRFLPDEQATMTLASEVYRALPRDRAGWTILLTGELGAGKSTFARALIKAAGHSGSVPSPTYTLVEPYKLPSGNIYHIDLYRVSSEDELYYLGFDELDDGLCLVEWPDRAPRLAEAADLLVELRYEGSARHATLTGRSARGHALTQKIN
ncbi:MAG: tRNA (adenosine(37)-N6)-threonylcarbamoyltransferase complex ATPase subunit type 1 TsaE [Gammaproteobacteria bacterium]|nr:tRNA (adenosine(37)-N6)-threonylcarbamoyltransferase complex ATPase subunit type 1 TsaE [Gammaproteobacteria bacterium]MDH5239435.1 tRNA (adenosine(37)-N6)-threonylcarbamoyltransferase complex ATPase subunit type 1 TsaE [Gammaproteobacteria bacterium]MDH5260037.1 tRNA (adenosine(37)-N6)-threonylcarbamoyltransferase complex ATPase subunit type 1 TsaE [Gammaproteobacteria bacterium]MDH5582894.1 tRNA (adenosine(37)-N6)-threonylcarbamoyltransferase complex ATPase subunit type 1 TsaE [Gammaproteob